MRMKTFLALILAFTLSLAVPFWAHAAGQWVSLDADSEDGVQISILESGPVRTVVELRLDGYWQDQMEIEGVTHGIIDLPGRTTLMEKGLPDLPKVRERLIVPDDAYMVVRVLEVDELEMETLPIAPSKGHLPRSIDPATVPYEFDDFYQSDTWYPTSNVQLGDPFIVRDFRGISLQLNPIQYNPALGRLRIYRRLVVEVFSTGPGRSNVKRRSKGFDRMDADFESLYRRLFLNYSAAKYTPVLEQGRMLIICDNGFYSDTLPLYHWKLQKGVPTKLALYPDSTGSGSGALQSYIQNEYDSADGLTYVLLVGDVDQIPTLYGTAEGAPSDPCYVKLEGSDHYPDAFISRLSATSAAQVENQVEKFVNYEASPDTGAAAAWYHKGTGVGSDDSGGTDLMDWERMDLLRADLLGYTYTHVDQIYDPGATAAQVTTAVNDGRSIVNYIGHGGVTSWSTTGFSNSNVNALSNGHMLPYICDVACDNGKFTYGSGDCFAEAWLKAGSAGSPKGAIGIYASSTLADWMPPCVMQTEVVDLLVAEQKNTFGGLSFNGVMKAMDEYAGTVGTKLMEQYNLFGDCSLVMRTDVPTTMTVNHDPIILVDATSYDVQVPGVEGALTSLYHDGVFYGSSYTNAAGYAAITLVQSFPGPGQVTLTVTAYNRVPYVTTLDVVTPSGPYMVYESHIIDDVAGGNGDGMVNPGEDIGMPVSLRNAGSDPATAVTALLTIDDPYVQIADSLENYGDVPAGSTATCVDDYDFQVLGGCPDGHVLDFTLEISSAETTWVEHGLNITVAAPDLAYEDHVIDDSGGNGNGQADPDETFDITISLKNWGYGTAMGVSALLSSDDGYLDVQVNTASYGDILPGQVASSLTAYTVSVDAGCPPGHVADLILDMTAGGSYAAADTFQISIGQRPILLVDDDDGKSYQSYWLDALDANGYSYEVWELSSKGSPPPDSLNQYRIVLWTTADDYGYTGSPTTLTATDQANLQAYLDAGGNLFLSSQDVLYDNNPVTSFITDYLHLADHTDDTHPTQVSGFDGDPISDRMDLPLSHPFSNWGDDIVVGTGATCIFENNDYSTAEFIREGPPAEEDLAKGGEKQGACGALRYPDEGSSTYKVVFSTVAFEAISTSAPDPNNQKMVLANIIDWFLGDCIPPSPVTNLVAILGENQLVLEWSPAIDSKGVDHYVIYRNTQPDFLPSATDSMGSAVDTFFVDTSSAIGDTLTNHYYSVKAVDGAGNKSFACGNIGEFDIHLIALDSTRVK